MKINNFEPSEEINTRNATGFGSPAQEFEEVDISGKLASLLIPRPSSTYYFKSSTDSMAPLISKGDLLIVDRSVSLKSGSICICSYQGRFLVREIYISPNRLLLKSINSRFREIIITELNDLEIFGTVISLIRNFGA